MYYGNKGASKFASQYTQDMNAETLDEVVVVKRAVSKSSKLYNNFEWDLVDAYRMGRVNLSTMSNSDFPADMQRMTLAQKEQHIKRKADERQRLRQRMQGLATVRQESVKRAEITKANRGVSGRATNGKAPVRTQSLDQAIGQSVGKKMNRVPVATKPASSRSTSAVEARPSSWSQPKTRQATPPTSSRGTVNRNSSATSRNTRVVRPAPSPRTSSNTRTSSSTRTRPNPSSSTRSSSSASTRSNPSTSTRSSSRTSPSRSTTVRSAPSPSRRATIKRPAPTPKPAPRATPSPRRSAPVAKPKVEKKVTPAPRQAPKPASSRSMMSRKIRN